MATNDLKCGDLVAHMTDMSWPWMAMSQLSDGRWVCVTVTQYCGRYEAWFHKDELVRYRPVKTVDDAMAFAHEVAVCGQDFEAASILREVGDKLKRMANGDQDDS